MEERTRMDAAAALSRAERRRLMVRDGLMFLWLTLVALVMAVITTVLFRTFESHRETLAEEAAVRGRQALQMGHPADAVKDFRLVLEYRRGDRDDQLALARALAASGQVDQAESYFLNLWQAQPGDGSINLELARVKRQQGKMLDAIQYYRAAVFGTWSGDAPRRRRDIRLELSQYLIERGQKRAARAELLIASGNNPDAATQLRIATLMEAAGDPQDALVDDRNAAGDKRLAATANEEIANLCFALGDYACAQSAAQRWAEVTHANAASNAKLLTLRRDAERLQELAVLSDMPVQERSRHLLEDARIAQDRLAHCAEANPSTDLAALQSQWKVLDTAKGRSALRNDDSLREQFRQQISVTEHTVTQVCGAATGDDALLLYLETHPMTHAGAQP